MGRAITTTRQATTLSKMFTDLDFYRRRYGLVEDNDENIVVRFVAPQICAFEEYRYVFLKNSVTKELKPNYFYRPDYVSYEEYGTTNLWSLLLFINDIATIEEFNREFIIVPTRSVIYDISLDVIRREPYKEIVPLRESIKREKARLYFNKKPIFKSQIQTPAQKEFVAADLYQNRETFVLSTINVLQRYVDLTYEPVIESVKLNIQNKPNYIYGKHFSIVKGDSQLKNRLTWDPRKLTGLGLMDVMVENTTFDVLYSRKMK